MCIRDSIMAVKLLEVFATVKRALHDRSGVGWKRRRLLDALAVDTAAVEEGTDRLPPISEYRFPVGAALDGRERGHALAMVTKHFRDGVEAGPASM